MGVRCPPLADETRLRILELLAQEGELSSQDLIDQLEISQSGVSRHLKALGSYIVERRGEGAVKHYRLNMNHLDWTFVTLRRFLTSDEAQAEPAIPSQPSVQDLSRNARGFPPQTGNRVGPRVRKTSSVEAPSELLRFMDDQGRITGYPTKRKDMITLLEYLATKFEPERSYTEKEVNSILSAQLHPSYTDFVTIRRELYNFQFLGRERDGSRYWRIVQATDQLAQDPAQASDSPAR
jgi:DNA-binding transcriptional ArsR family regulator